MSVRLISFLAFIALCLGGGTLIGVQTMPGEWYANLDKPFFNPPNWVFGPVWAVLYVMIAIAGWRTWIRDANGGLVKIWFAQLALNFSWSPTFFTYHWVLAAAVIIFVMVVLTVIFIVRSWSADRIASLLMLPYLAWISFATFLNITLWNMNFA